MATLGSLFLLLAGGKLASAQPLGDPIRANETYHDLEMRFRAVTDAGLFETVNRLTMPEYWSMAALGSNTPAVDLITRPRRQAEGRFYPRGLFTAHLNGAVPGDLGNAALADLAVQVQPWSCVGDRGFSTRAPRGLFRFSRAETDITVGAETYRTELRRYMVAPTMVADFFGFKVWAGPKLMVTQAMYREPDGTEGTLLDETGFGFLFQIGQSPAGGEDIPPFEWALTAMDIAFSGRIVRDLAAMARFVDQPAPDEQGTVGPRMWELELNARFGTLDERRTVGLTARYWAFTADAYLNYWTGRIAWANLGGEARWPFLILAVKGGIVEPVWEGADLEWNIAVRVAGNLGETIFGVRLQLYAEYERVPYEFDSAASAIGGEIPQRLIVGVASTWG